MQIRVLPKKTTNILRLLHMRSGLKTQRQTDGGNWIIYDNTDPVYSDVLDFNSGENRVTYFDF
ncbi:MAG: hypothetical protein L6V93_04610 [Clostridiales bacterium]|nr:MAG: hypothetical protein L6V93_04610 [Clostridiales bacterium]